MLKSIQYRMVRKRPFSHNIGFGDENGLFQLHENKSNIGASSIINSEENLHQETVAIVLKRLDDCQINFGSLCFIKIDVEGFEANVIRGGLKVIKEQQPLILLEQNINQFEAGETKSILLLSEMDYRFCWYQGGVTSSQSWFLRRIQNARELFFGRVHLIRSAPTVPTGNYSMLIAVPPRFHNKLLK